jgi:hypothetical protein
VSWQDRKAVLRLAHACATRATLTSAAEWQRLAREAIAEHDRALIKIAQLERELKIARRAILYPMTDLA